MRKQDSMTIDMIGEPTILIGIKPGPRFFWLKMNQAAESYMGCNLEDLGTPDLDEIEGLDLVRAKQRNEFNRRCKYCFAARDTVSYENRYQRPDGKFLWSRNCMVPIFDGDGNVERILSSFVDITDLKDNQGKMQPGIDAIATPIIIVRVELNERFFISALNTAAEKYIGVTFNELEGQGSGQVEDLNELQILQREKIIENVKLCIAGKVPVFAETRELMLDDKYRWGHTTYTPVFDAEGNIRQIMITTVDITELMETQKRLEKSEKELEEELTKTLNGFVTVCAACKSISHGGSWLTIERYASEQLGFHQFSHGMCPSCVRDYYGERKDR